MMKRAVIMGTAVILAASSLYTMPVHAESTVANAIASVGVGEILEQDKTEEEYKEAVGPVELYGYNNIGIANVDNHLNVRETPDESGIGKDV